MQPKIDKIHRQIERDFPAVRHIDAGALKALNPDDRVVFDVRKPEEFAVSHIAGAIRVDTGIDPATFVELYGEAIADKKIVFYCSVGRRSSTLAAKILAAMEGEGGESEGGVEIYNLKGGVFGWHNQGQPLSRGAVATDFVHPYNAQWGRLIDDPAAISYKPRDLSSDQ